MKRRLLAGMLTLVMALSLLPTAVLADEQTNGLTAVAADTLPAEGQTTPITLSGGTPGEQTVRISGYDAHWYVTDGLVLQYDGIYNTGVAGTHDGTDTQWTPLVSTVGDMEITIPTNLKVGEGWTTDDSLYLKDTAIGDTNFDSELTADNGFTWDYMFALNSEDYNNWNMAKNPYYQWPVKLIASPDAYNLGAINNSTRVLFYGGKVNWPPYLTPFQGDTMSTLTLTTGRANADAHRKVYQNGSLDSHPNVSNGVPKGDAAAYTNAETVTFAFNGIVLPTMRVIADYAIDGVAYNLGRTVYGTRLYDHELTAAEIAQNAAVDARRYTNGEISIGTANGQQLLEQFDKDGNAYTEIAVTFDSEGNATIPLVLNYTFEGWTLNGDLITDANGDSYDWWDSLSNAEVVAQWTSSAEANAALEITEAEDIYALARIFDGTGTNADYQRFGYNAASTDAKNKLMDAATAYELKEDITLTNHSDDASNGFYGIPNFAGTLTAITTPLR